MAFASYTSINKVIDKYRIRCSAGPVVAPAADALPFNDYFREELAFNLREFPTNPSEGAAGELLIFPLLREAWKPFRGDLSLFSHEPVEADADLCGTPDYFACRRSEYGRSYPTPPYLLVVEAKMDDFARAWGQCLAAMLAAQKLNGDPHTPIHGIATNGQSWAFGRLVGDQFTEDREPVALRNLDTLGQMMHAVFRVCTETATSPAPVAS